MGPSSRWGATGVAAPSNQSDPIPIQCVCPTAAACSADLASLQADQKEA